MDGIKGSGQAAHISMLQQYRYMMEAIQEVRSGKAETGNTIDQTTLNYKLDADERGVLSSATPSGSHVGVTNQEQTNIRRLTAEAQARGEDVVAVNIEYEANIVDGKTAIAAGRTEVVSIPSADRVAEVYQANKEATASLKPFDLDDNAAARLLSGGMQPEPETDSLSTHLPTICEKK